MWKHIQISQRIWPSQVVTPLHGSFNFHSTKTFGLNYRQLSLANGTALGKISKKEENLSRYTQILGNFPEVFFPFNFVPWISRIFDWMVRILEIQQFPELLETFPENVCTICRCFQLFESFGWIDRKASTVSFTDWASRLVSQVSRALSFFLLPSLPSTQRGLCRGDRQNHEHLNKLIRIWTLHSDQNHGGPVEK